MSFVVGLILGIIIVPFLNKVFKYNESEIYHYFYLKGDSARKLLSKLIEMIKLKYNNSGENK